MRGILGVIGSPIGHSLSPLMHNAALKHLGLDYEYFAFDVSDVSGAISGLRALGIRGFNVTIPHKVTVLDYLDHVDDLALKIGACNTVVNREGELFGYNTDCSGALDAIAERIGVSGKNVCVLGAGGASRAVCFGLVDAGANVSVVNRGKSRGLELVSELNCVGFLGFDELSRDVISGFDVLINTTPVGMFPNVGVSPLPKDFLHEGLLVMDIVYNPLETQLLRDAQDIGCPVIGGVEMFVNQGARAFELFTGQKAPKDVMRMAVLKKLG